MSMFGFGRAAEPAKAAPVAPLSIDTEDLVADGGWVNVFSFSPSASKSDDAAVDRPPRCAADKASEHENFEDYEKGTSPSAPIAP